MPLNLGYACMNMHLSETEKITSSRTCRKATFKEKGLSHIAMLFETNLDNVLKILKWNSDNRVTLYRMSSDIAPWCSEYNLVDLPNWKVCKRKLAAIGEYARHSGQRLSFHPGAYTVLAGTNKATIKKSLHELEVHGQIMDGLGMPRSRNAKINIHIGGAYGDKTAAISRFIKNYRRLSPAVTSRLTLENDDRPNLYTVRDLVELVYPHIKTPIVFDYHHHAIHPGNDSEETALHLAAKTWGSVKQTTHYSETAQKDNPRAVYRAHSIMVEGYINTHGLDIDCMIEAKGKERAMQKYISIYGEDNEIR
jgi:UV DNA damage endonuclease